ncbi:MAG: hypothetical protein HKN17_03390, partial [Rhodothermales bacterium]|nr:hypothetical protein [Rhodothermales bacterium]
GKTIPDLEQLRGQNQSSDAGFLGVEDPIRVQEGRVSFVSRWGERPLVPNWRREAALSNAEIAADSGLQEAAGPLTDEEGPDELPEIDISAVPRDSTARMNMVRDRALARYELGNTLFLGMNRPDSAAVWYRMVLDEGDSTDVSQRALYALAEVQYSLGDTTSATRLYRDILDRYPDSDFSDNVRERLGMEREVLSTDSVSVALATYGKAFARWDSSGTRLSSRRAFNEMLRIAGTWPSTGAGARSLLSAAEIHLDMAGADSSAIFGPLPITVDDSVIEPVWPAKAKALQGQAGAASRPAADTTLSDPAAADTAFAASVTAGSEALARVSPFGHVAITDSLVLAVLPPGGAGQADALVPSIRQIRVDDGGAFLQTQQPGILASELRIHDLLEAVGRLHPRTPFATRAQRLTGLLDELLIVEVREDSTAADSLASEDSGGPPVTGVVAGDSLGLTVPTDSVAIVTPDSAGVFVADSTGAVLDPADSAVERLRTREASLAAAELSGKQRFVPRTLAPTPDPTPAPVDTLQVSPGAVVDDRALEFRDDEDRFEPDIDTPEAILERERIDSGEPEFVADPNDADEAALDDLPSGLIVDPAELEEEGIRSSSSLRPLASDGEADEAAVGWTAVFQTSRDMATAQLERRRFKVMLGEQGDALRLLVHTRSDESEVLVAWGLFDTRAELQVALDIARRDAGDSFPDDPQIIVLIP